MTRQQRRRAIFQEFFASISAQYPSKLRRWRRNEARSLAKEWLIRNQRKIT